VLVPPPLPFQTPEGQVYDDLPGVRVYFDMLLEAGGRAGTAPGVVLGGGGGLGLLWGGRTIAPLWRRWFGVVVRGRGSADPHNVATGPDPSGTHSGALAFIDARFFTRFSRIASAWTFEIGPSYTPFPAPGGGGGFAVAYGTAGATGLAVRFDTTIFRTGEGTSAVFSLGVLLGVAGYRD
jgi:hypothetical protein